MSRKNQTRSPQNKNGAVENEARTGATKTAEPAAASDPAAGLRDVEASFRSVVETVEGSLRQQTEAFDTMLQTAQVALHERAALGEEKQSLEATIATLNGDCAKLKRDLVRLDQERTALVAEGEAQSVEIAALRTRTEEEQARADRAEAERDTHRGDLETMRKERGELLAEQEAQSVAIAALETTSTEQRTRADEAERERGILTKKRDKLQAELAEITVRCNAALCDVEELTTARTELEAARDALQTQLEEATEEIRLWTDRATTAEQARDELTGRCAKLDEHVADATAQNAHLSKLLARMESERDRLSEEAEALTAQLEESTKERDMLREQVNVASQEQTKVQSARQSLESCLTELMSKCEALESDRQAPAVNAEAAKELERLRHETTQLRSKVATLEHSLESAERRHAVGEGADVAVARVLSNQVSGAAQLVDELREAKMPEDLRKHLLGRAVDMFTHLSAAAGIAVASDEEDAVSLEPKPVDVRALIADTVTRLESVPSGKKKLTLTTNVDAHLPSHVGVDEARLEQLVCWCIEYTRRYAKQGEVVIGASIDKDSGHLRVSVYNDGGGMSTDVTEVALDRRAGTGPDEAQRRTELAGFRHLADRMGGELRLEAVGSLGFAATVLVAIEQDDRSPDDRRDDDRVLLQMLQCSLGPIVDLSPTGVRIRCNKPLKNRVNIDIPFEGRRIRLKADALWGKQVNRKEFEYGLRFLHVSMDQEQQLRRLAKRHGFRPAA